MSVRHKILVVMAITAKTHMAHTDVSTKRVLIHTILRLLKSKYYVISQVLLWLCISVSS